MSNYYHLTFLFILPYRWEAVKKVLPVPPTETLDKSSVESILSNPEKLELIAKFNREYYHWDELRYRVDDSELESTWALMKIMRKTNFKHLKVCGMDLGYALLSDFQESLYTIDRNSAGLVEIDNPGEKEFRRYVTSSLMEEAIASSQMEGATTTRTEAKKMLRANRKPMTVSETMIVNNYLAMEFIKSKLKEPMSPELMMDMHRIITKDTLHEGKEWEGRFREDNETVVGDVFEEDVVFHVPPSHDRIPDMIQGLCRFINDDDTEFIHPVIKGIIIHFMIGYIHPFVNGNGRLARTLFYWYLLKKDYWLIEYTSISRIIKKSQTKYGLAYQYTETDENDLTYFIKFNLACIINAVKDLRTYIERKTREQKAALKEIESDSEINRWESLILKDYLRDQTLFSIREISIKYNLAYQTARNYINHLTELEYVRIGGKDGKTRLYKVVRDDNR